MPLKDPELTTADFRKIPESDFERALKDYYICRVSRELSNIIRKDVLSGRAKFGVSDDGKELYQVAMARAVRDGDWRADYYRGHTLLLTLDMATPEQLLAQLYSDENHDPFSGGRQMGGHYANATIDGDGNWLDATQRLNLSSATSPTAGQMARGFGLAYASKVYRRDERLPARLHSDEGNEIAWTEIGDASTSEGIFWETMNAAGVTGVPMVCTVVDDGYGISVPVDLQTTKGSISAAMAGLKREEGTNGIDIYRVEGWDYPALIDLFPEVARQVRKNHRTALIHIRELTQPNGHSTSGSHERYKSAERLAWEKKWDCLAQFRHYLLATGIAEASELDELDKKAKKVVAAARKSAWENIQAPRRARREKLLSLLPTNGHRSSELDRFAEEVTKMAEPLLSNLIDAVRHLRFEIGADQLPRPLAEWLRDARRELAESKGSNLLSNTPQSPLRLGAVEPHYPEKPKSVPGYEILQHFFAAKFEQRPELFAFGEDVGEIGDVNQGFAGLQERFGKHRVFDTGIREWTIVGQAMGMAMRGLRPIAEIQYLDYIFYALPMLTDDVATLRWRSNGMQACPLIIRTRGHRLEGVWHSGSYLSPLIGSLRGMHLCVPRNMVQAAGMYNTLLEGDDPAVVIEVLNAYRLRENEPENLAEFRVPLGVPELLRPGTDLTIVTYGACVRVCLEAAERLAAGGIEAEVIDLQTLLPFDLEHRLVGHLAKTNRLLIVDEDMPGGASAYIERQIIEEQKGFNLLDAPVRTLTAAVHRPAYADDGNYASKPQVMDVVEAAQALAAF
ncbi:pyruvate/2-oxoglutarate/acetoin dehydrogenase E1 component/TPP-dependent pyruvate/acetoin dehydrogenase alpha subunit [Lewinella aquimaris]|uniref:3-methyl-2-oxobutanoate dehydrogenase (2-methylpropanoyl-transferring) n=1 Tax=Neolewinella aquimaris TaxID=1835722 RepID=A0A840E9M5_9BACT|nr:alpha-ketoacid dehydrogenase subunit alpha/beta [Neolewinella aquimaris]MBB4080643.1 pyruvate/2-oxoglutarate/acetoin dehydrogenase E1 component/TPP-dependent pyruvate/acetoin dehydrogenase alpha subunit [Neolewinella aquimaris]